MRNNQAPITTSPSSAGRVIAVRGSIVDCRFARGLPGLRQALRAGTTGDGTTGDVTTGGMSGSDSDASAGPTSDAQTSTTGTDGETTGNVGPECSDSAQCNGDVCVAGECCPVDNVCGEEACCSGDELCLFGQMQQVGVSQVGEMPDVTGGIAQWLQAQLMPELVEAAGGSQARLLFCSPAHFQTTLTDKRETRALHQQTGFVADADRAVIEFDYLHTHK